MKWQLKAKIQNLVNIFPSSLSYSTYYWIQRNFGGLRKDRLSPINRLEAGIETVRRIEQVGRSPVGGTFLEVGMGR